MNLTPGNGMIYQDPPGLANGMVVLAGFITTFLTSPPPSPQFPPVPDARSLSSRAPHVWQSSRTGPLAQTCSPPRLVTNGTSKQSPTVTNLDTDNQVFKAIYDESYMYICVYIYVYVYAYVYGYGDMDTYMYMYMYMYMDIDMYMYVYTYIYTYIYI